MRSRRTASAAILAGLLALGGVACEVGPPADEPQLELDEDEAPAE